MGKEAGRAFAGRSKWGLEARSQCSLACWFITGSPGPPGSSLQDSGVQDTLKSNDLWWMTLASAWVHGRVAAFISMIPFFLLSLSFLGWG